ncbi:hypothetical protein [Thermocoleostomius sinensis]|jgi:N-acyl-D-aspartate/D-glutamate deacylase|uniref:Uncharacterized protein n=1 Tax=Thermocoleostomius sinensis A174 TaxID=2016057 RepID=A0A9E8ZCN5_9CYAN|nr:hypothetical protein [Thermocoleostomius sinensis]WAL59397.1 hypothetical protein OXH18_19815 [Thermocoleostomius sinensis A174]
MLQRFIIIGLMGLVLSVTACDRLSQLEHLEQGNRVSPLPPTMPQSSAVENAIKETVIRDNALKAPTEDALTGSAIENAASNVVSSPSLEEAWLPEFQETPSAQLKADLKEQARRVKQTP